MWARAGDEIRTRDIQLGRLTLYQLSYSRKGAYLKAVEREGFEPSKATPADLQSAPFDHSGISPKNPCKPWLCRLLVTTPIKGADDGI